MQLSDFDYHLPPELIAHYPSQQRSHSRLLHLDGNSGRMTHGRFKALLDFLNPGDLLVFNDTKVIPARLFGQKQTGGKIELLIERILDTKRVLTHIKSSKSPKTGQILYFDQGYKAEVLQRHDSLFELCFINTESVLDIVQEIGQIPLPPYIERAPETIDDSRYQTVYAKHEGAVAAPTAGLHFDDDLMTELEEAGIEKAFVTLHVGAGTFQPVRCQDIEQHRMHKEFAKLDESVCEKIRAVKARNNKVYAVGTTSVRTLETAMAVHHGDIQAYAGETDIFIYPGYQFQCVDGLITNFHLPQSTLLMLVAAFAGYENIMQAYRTAVAEKYRFFSYGDAMLLMRQTVERLS